MSHQMVDYCEKAVIWIELLERRPTRSHAGRQDEFYSDAISLDH